MIFKNIQGVQCLIGGVLDSGPRGRGFEPSARHIYPSLVLVKPRKTRPCLTERLLVERNESNQHKQTNQKYVFLCLPLQTVRTPMKCSIVLHFIWVFTVCKSAQLGVSRIQRVKIYNTRLPDKNGYLKNNFLYFSTEI